METFIDLCRKFPWSWKIKASYKRLVNNKDNERETRNEMEKILSRSVRYAGRSIQSPETVDNLEGTIEFLEMLVLNLNAFNTELSEEFPNFDDRILPLLEKYSELLVYRSKQTGLEVECLQRMYTFLQGLSIHKDNKISAAARTKKLLEKTTFNIKASVPAPDVSIIGDKQEEINNNIETVESAPEASITNGKDEEEVNNNIETVESCAEKRVRFAETSPKRIDPVEWDAEVTPEPSPGNGHQASSSTDSGGADAATNKDERNQSDETSSNSSSTTSVPGERKKEDSETEQEESDSRYHSLEPNSTNIRQQGDSSEDEEKGGSKRRYYSLEPCYSNSEEKKSKSPAMFDLSSDDEYDKELLTPLETIIESLASTPKNNEEFRRQLFANKKKDADSSHFVKPAVPVHKRRILSSESSNEDGPAAKPSTSQEATFLRPAVRALQLHSDSDSTMGEITLKATSTPVIEPTRPHQMPEQVELSDARRIIPESPLKGEGSARVLAIPSEITPIIASSEPFVFPGVPTSLTSTPAAASSPKAGSSISTASSNTVRLSLASSTTEKLSSAAPSPTSIASSTTAKLSSVTPSTSTAELSLKTTSTASSSTSKLPSSDGSTTTAELPTSSASSSSGTVKSNFSVSQSPEQPKIKESALVATAKWIVENQPVVGGNSPATAAVELRPKVMKALSRSVRERRLHSSKWNVSDFKTPSPNRLVPDKTSSIENGLSHKMIPTAGTEQSPPKPVTITLNELKRSMEGNLLGCDASISDAEILEEIESSVNRSGGSDEDPSKPVDFGQEDGDAPGDNLALLSAFDNNTQEGSSNKKGTKPSSKGASPVEQERRRSPRLTGQPYFYVPLEITRKKEPLPGTSTSTASKRKSTAAAPDSEEIPAKKVATGSKRKLTMAPSPKPITEENSPPLIPITWAEVRKQLPPCWASLIDQHVRDMGQENNLMYREGTPTLRLKVYCPCTPHIGQSKCSE